MKFSLALAVLFALTACGNSSEDSEPSANSAPAQGGGGGNSNFGTVSLSPGFTAPSAQEGTSGGSTDAASLDPSCVGNVSDTPDHLLELSGAIPNLRVFAHADQDITLVVQRPDNSFLCNDDFEDLNPLVHAEAWPAGTYKVWVGNYDASEGGASYKLGFSTADDAAPSQLGS